MLTTTDVPRCVRGVPFRHQPAEVRDAILHHIERSGHRFDGDDRNGFLITLAASPVGTAGTTADALADAIGCCCERVRGFALRPDDPDWPPRFQWGSTAWPRRVIARLVPFGTF